MTLVKQLVPNTIAYLLIRLGKDGKGEGEREKHVKGHFIFVAVQFSILSTSVTKQIQRQISEG